MATVWPDYLASVLLASRKHWVSESIVFSGVITGLLRATSSIRVDLVTPLLFSTESC